MVTAASTPSQQIPANAGDDPDSTAAELRRFADQVTSLFVELADLLGVPKSVAMIYGELFASPVPLCFADIEERTGISKGSVSQGLRFLREVGAVREVGASPHDSARGRAVEHYEAVVELRALLLRLLTEKVQPQLDSGQTRVAEVVATWQTLSEGPKQVLGPRVEHLQIWPKRTREFLPLIRTFLSFGK
jgi:HTH-type transcriptional regulator, glycine betaine synthesis regulator